MPILSIMLMSGCVIKLAAGLGETWTRDGGDVHLLLLTFIKSFDTVDRGVLDRVSSCLGLAGWFRHAYFEYHCSC